jgi:hypothetical protein
VNLQTDLLNCGACGNVCPNASGGQSPTCVAGRCGYTCNPGFGNCDSNLGNGCEAPLAADINNCGVCGTVCATPANATAVCTHNRCGIGTCNEHFADCNGYVGDGCERNLATDVANCGACGNGCFASQTCVAGVCTGAICLPGQTLCSGLCVNLASDTYNCGGCGYWYRCNAGQVCTSGRCVAAPTTCPTGQMACGSSGGAYCATLTIDVNNCGACGRACATGQTCSAGTCVAVCAASLTNCSGVCRDIVNDNNNCGACGNVCGAGTFCERSWCRSCATGQTLCGTTCVNAQTDTANCGFCGHACTTGQTCVAGTCTATIVCAVGQTNCSGVCRDLVSDNNNCGTCGNICGTGTLCERSWCRSCSAGQTLCGTMCVNAQIDTANCGTCGHACATGQTCAAGVCTPSSTCTTGQTLCSGTCVNAQTDVANCGSCGHACTSGQVCTAGVCVTGTTPPPASCSLRPFEVTFAATTAAFCPNTGEPWQAVAWGVRSGEVIRGTSITVGTAPDGTPIYSGPTGSGLAFSDTGAWATGTSICLSVHCLVSGAYVGAYGAFGAPGTTLRALGGSARVWANGVWVDVSDRVRANTSGTVIDPTTGLPVPASGHMCFIMTNGCSSTP